MGRDADDNFWPQGKGSSAVTTSIIPHKFGYGRVARKRRAIPKFADNRSNPARKASYPLKIGRMLRQNKRGLEKGTPHANLSLRRSLSGGCRLNCYGIPPDLDHDAMAVSVIRPHHGRVQISLG